MERRITQARIRRLCRRIAAQYAPERIILIGSRAARRARADSDVDLLVVMRYRGHSARMAARILNRVEPDFPVDLIVRTPLELRRRVAQRDAFLSEALSRGKVLYEAARA